MSSAYDNSSTQQDWQGQYPYLHPDESGPGRILCQSFGEHHETTGTSRSPRTVHSGYTAVDATQKGSSASSASEVGGVQERSNERAGIGFQPGLGMPEDGMYTVKRQDEAPERSSGRSDASFLLADSTNAGSTRPAGQDARVQPEQREDVKQEGCQGQGDDVDEDDDMIDVEGEPINRPQTVAERTAARRKMKRFR